MALNSHWSLVLMNKQYKNSRNSILYVFSLMLMSIAGASSQDLKTGLSALNTGNSEEARVILEKAYRKNPSDPNAKLAYAETAPCSTAIQLYNELSKSENVRDSIKACAFCRLGDHSYTMKDYQKAVEFYRQASKHSTDPNYRHKWALSSMIAGDSEAAQSLWHTLSLEYGDDVSLMANYYLGLLQLKHGNYQNAHNFFMKTGKPDMDH
jgi:Flp pilus assembly protein TadD